MNGLWHHLDVSLRLHLRNRMALVYGYLFPLIFLVAFWVLYRFEKVPISRHLGELLTVSVLGGACFGLPTAMVSERERGVWRRYRLAPVPTWSVVASTVAARYLIVLSAGLLQLGLARAIGMPWPAHGFDLWVAFTLVSFAFIGLGLVIAMLADTVPAVQALGQCIFLPMLIIGGVAVQLTSLPPWAQHLSAFFPGRYAVEAMQVCVNGAGLGGVKFDLLALVLIGAAGCLAGAKLFRWDAQQKLAARTSKLWALPALAAWLGVGLLAEGRGRIAIFSEPAPASAMTVAPTATPPANVPAPPPVAPVAMIPTPSVAVGPLPKPTPPPAPWTKLTTKDIEGLDYNVPPDGGVVSPIAPADEDPDDYVRKILDAVRAKLPTWEPASDPDEVQAVRNCLYVAAVPDAIQMPIERHMPLVVLEYLTDTRPKENLVKLLAWIALHPDDGTVITDISELGSDGAAGDPNVVRERAYLYAIKFIARLTERGNK